MKKNILILLIAFISFPFFAGATHIVGGEIQMTRLASGAYKFTLNLYFDDINGNKSAEDNDVTIDIFSKRTNALVESILLNTKTQQSISYTNNACTIGQLRTRQIQYSKEVTLTASKYTDSDGYYVSWQRCCRNNVIINIANPGNVGMVFYMEFPPLNVANSSPKFSLPKGDYACRNDLFLFDFSAVDDDKDQLQYYMATPMIGNTLLSSATTIARPRPYALATWVAGYGANNAIQGSPSLSIDPISGILTVKANRIGLYVFSVICEEYRNGVKIGQVNRDYQLLVIDCPVNNSPVVRIREKGKVSFYSESDTLYIKSQEARCFDAIVTDLDFNNRLTVTTRAINFQQKNSFLATNTATNTGAPINFDLCFPECTFVDANQTSFIFEVIVSDDGCPLPKRDTIRITLVVIPDPNSPPTVTSSLGTNKIDVIVSNNLSFDIIGKDTDNDNITIRAYGRGFELSDLGMNFSNPSGKGQIVVPFNWTSSCGSISESDNLYIIDFVITDSSRCFKKTDTVTIEINLKDTPFDDAEFKPANVFTPNEDGKNDVYFLTNIPQETCLYYFKKVEIYNRWGNTIFKDTDKNFKWHGTTATAGVYYYYIDFGRKKYKGMITVIE